MIEPIVIVGGGPSAAAFDLKRLCGRAFVVAVNDSFRKMRWADVVFGADGRWMNGRIAELAEFKGRIVLAVPAPEDVPKHPWEAHPPAIARAEIVRRLPGIGVSRDPGAVYFGDNSGFAALNWCAAAFPGSHIALVGFDLAGPGWWHDGYEWNCRIGAEHYGRWANGFDHVARKIAKRCDVVNVNPDSAIRAYRFASFDAVVDRSAWQLARL